VRLLGTVRRDYRVLERHGTAPFRGNSLVYLPKNVATDDPLFLRDDDAIPNSFISALIRIIPGFDSTGGRGVSDVARAQRLSVPHLLQAVRPPPSQHRFPA